eukprot:4022066-Alexandrium_andersonii.AAC.1
MPGGGGVHWRSPELSDPRNCEIARGIRSLNCAGPGMASTFAPKATEGCSSPECYARVASGEAVARDSAGRT